MDLTKRRLFALVLTLWCFTLLQYFVILQVSPVIGPSTQLLNLGNQTSVLQNPTIFVMVIEKDGNRMAFHREYLRHKKRLKKHGIRMVIQYIRPKRWKREKFTEKEFNPYEVWHLEVSEDPEDLGYCEILPRFEDTTKLFWGIKQAIKNEIKFDYAIILKDSSYFRFDHYVLNVLPTLPRHSLHHGFFWGPSVCDNFLDGIKFKYSLGIGTVLSRNLIEFIATIPWKVIRLDAPDDLALSLWLLPLKTHRVHDRRFHHVQKVPFVRPGQLEPLAWSKCSDDDILLYNINWDHIDPKTGKPECIEQDYKCVTDAEACQLATKSEKHLNGLNMVKWMKDILNAPVNTNKHPLGHWCKESPLGKHISPELKKVCKINS